MAEMDGVDLDLELSSLKFTADDEELLDTHQPPPDADAATEEPVAMESSVAGPAVTWHEDTKDNTRTSPLSSSASSPPTPRAIAARTVDSASASAASLPPSSKTTAAIAPRHESASASPTSPSLPVSQTESAASALSSAVPPAAAPAAAAAATPAVETAAITAVMSPGSDPTASDSPARSASSSLSASRPSHSSRPSVIDFAAGRPKVNLAALSLQPDEYRRMFRAVLTLQRKCRQWRVRIKEKMRQRVVEERRRQEAELQLKLHNLKEQKKHSQALRRAAAVEKTQPPAPPPPAPLPSPPPPAVAGAASVWGVELPPDAQDKLRFTLSMMKIQRLFRAKLARARLRLVEKLKNEKEEQEREMRARIEKRQQKKRAEQQQQEEKQDDKRREQEEEKEEEKKTEVGEEKQQQLSQEAAASATPFFSLPLHLLQEGKEEPLRGSLTSRLRRERQLLQQQQQQAATVKETRSIDIQVDAEELRETAALQSVPSAALRVELSDQSLPFIADSQLLDQHLQLMAALSTLSVPAAASAAAVSLEAMGDGAGGGDFVLTSPLLGLQYLSSALYSRVFEGWREEDEEDWESIIHLPLPAV